MAFREPALRLVSCRLTDDDLIARYFAGEPLASIAAAAGISRLGIWKHLVKAGVTCNRRMPPVLKLCEVCGARVMRPRWRQTLKVFCSFPCYMLHVRQHGESYRPYRHGQRLARFIVGEVFPLRPGYVVHHHDGDNRNNAIENLAVFASQAEHMSFHRGGEGHPLWDGRPESARAGLALKAHTNLAVDWERLPEASGVPAHRQPSPSL